MEIIREKTFTYMEKSYLAHYISLPWQPSSKITTKKLFLIQSSDLVYVCVKKAEIF